MARGLKSDGLIIGTDGSRCAPDLFRKPVEQTDLVIVIHRTSGEPTVGGRAEMIVKARNIGEQWVQTFLGDRLPNNQPTIKPFALCYTSSREPAYTGRGAPIKSDKKVRENILEAIKDSKPRTTTMIVVCGADGWTTTPSAFVELDHLCPAKMLISIVFNDATDTRSMTGVRYVGFGSPGVVTPAVERTRG